MADNTNSGVFFQAMFEVFESLPPERRSSVIEELRSFGRFSELVRFLAERIEASSVSAASARAVIDLMSEYAPRADEVGPAAAGAYSAFILRVVDLRAAPSSLDRFANFMRTSFEISRDHGAEAVFKRLSGSPSENVAVSMAAFVLANPEYTANAFKFLLSAADPRAGGQKGLAPPQVVGGRRIAGREGLARGGPQGG